MGRKIKCRMLIMEPKLTNNPIASNKIAGKSTSKGVFKRKMWKIRLEFDEPEVEYKGPEGGSTRAHGLAAGFGPQWREEYRREVN